MTTDLFTLMKTRYPSFTKAEKKVADLVLSEPKKVMYMSIIDLACTCGVGDTTVFRFCKDLNLKGYQDFRIALAQSVTNDENETSTVDADISLEDSVDHLTTKILQSNIAALNETCELTDAGRVEQAVDWMIKARRILFFGVGTSLLTAMDAKNLFMRILPKVEVAMDSHMQAMSAALMGPEDVAIVISYSGSTKDTYHAAELAQKAGAGIIAITRFEKSPLTRLADLVLLCGANEGPLQGGALSSKMAQLYVLNILYFEMFRRTMKESKRNQEITADAVSDKLY